MYVPFFFIQRGVHLRYFIGIVLFEALVSVCLIKGFANVLNKWLIVYRQTPLEALHEVAPKCLKPHHHALLSPLW